MSIVFEEIIGRIETPAPSGPEGPAARGGGGESPRRQAERVRHALKIELERSSRLRAD